MSILFIKIFNFINWIGLQENKIEHCNKINETTTINYLEDFDVFKINADKFQQGSVKNHVKTKRDQQIKKIKTFDLIKKIFKDFSQYLKENKISTIINRLKRNTDNCCN